MIAAFVAFAGTATSGETLRKGAGRIAGTVLGLVAAVGLANLTRDTTAVAIAAILVCIFLAFFLQAVSYGAMIFFITVVLGQLYTLLGTFSDELLEIRLLRDGCRGHHRRTRLAARAADPQPGDPARRPPDVPEQASAIWWMPAPTCSTARARIEIR